MPFVRPGKHEKAGTAGIVYRRELPLESLRLPLQAIAQAIESHFAHDQRPVAGEVLQLG